MKKHSTIPTYLYTYTYKHYTVYMFNCTADYCGILFLPPPHAGIICMIIMIIMQMIPIYNRQYMLSLIQKNIGVSGFWVVHFP
jgi:hypothetical protein